MKEYAFLTEKIMPIALIDRVFLSDFKHIIGDSTIKVITITGLCNFICLSVGLIKNVSDRKGTCKLIIRKNNYWHFYCITASWELIFLL
jgi:hypothetical protein